MGFGVMAESSPTVSEALFSAGLSLEFQKRGVGKAVEGANTNALLRS